VGGEIARASLLLDQGAVAHAVADDGHATLLRHAAGRGIAARPAVRRPGRARRGRQADQGSGQRKCDAKFHGILLAMRCPDVRPTGASTARPAALQPGEMCPTDRRRQNALERKAWETGVTLPAQRDYCASVNYSVEAEIRITKTRKTRAACSPFAWPCS